MTMESRQPEGTGSNPDLVRSAALSSADLWHEILERLNEVQEGQLQLARAIESLGMIVCEALSVNPQAVLSGGEATSLARTPPRVSLAAGPTERHRPARPDPASAATGDRLPSGRRRLRTAPPARPGAAFRRGQPPRRVGGIGHVSPFLRRPGHARGTAPSPASRSRAVLGPGVGASARGLAREAAGRDRHRPSSPTSLRPPSMHSWPPNSAMLPPPRRHVSSTRPRVGRCSPRSWAPNSTRRLRYRHRPRPSPGPPLGRLLGPLLGRSPTEPIRRGRAPPPTPLASRPIAPPPPPAATPSAPTPSPSMPATARPPQAMPSSARPAAPPPVPANATWSPTVDPRRSPGSAPPGAAAPAPPAAAPRPTPVAGGPLLPPPVASPVASPAPPGAPTPRAPSGGPSSSTPPAPMTGPRPTVAPTPAAGAPGAGPGRSAGPRHHPSPGALRWRRSRPIRLPSGRRRRRRYLPPTSPCSPLGAGRDSLPPTRWLSRRRRRTRPPPWPPRSCRRRPRTPVGRADRDGADHAGRGRHHHGQGAASAFSPALTGPSAAGGREPASVTQRAGRRQVPVLPPVFSHRASSPMLMDRSADLHMS